MKEVKKLVEGYERFLDQDFEKQKDLYQKLSKDGQSPQFLVISCCDSRVDPAHIMNTAPGELFIVRNIANLVPVSNSDENLNCTNAAIEFAVKHLKVKHIIVFGHSQCGGIKALMEGNHPNDNYSFIDPWVELFESVKEKILEEHEKKSFNEQCSYCERACIEASLNNLMTFPWIKEKCNSGDLAIHGWYFEIETPLLSTSRNDSITSTEFLWYNCQLPCIIFPKLFMENSY